MKNLRPIATAVYAIPMIPKRLKGASEDRFFNRHKGSSTVAVNPNNVLERDKLKPTLEKIALNVSANIMEYAVVAKAVLMVQLAAAMALVSFPIDFSHASL